MKHKKRSQRRGPVVGGLKERNTKEARLKRAKQQANEMTERVRRDIHIPTMREIRDVGRTKAG